MDPHLGHESQLSRVEEHRLVGGKGDGMRLFEMDNGRGVQLTVSADRCCDISRLSFRGINMGYFAPCGYVHPAYYDPVGDGFLKSFTAGFLTTCGFQSAGSGCVDEGEVLPLHGSIANTPAQQVWWRREADALTLTGEVVDAALFGRKWRLLRTIRLSLTEDVFTVTDAITNDNDRPQPLEVLYHMNIGYPLLDRDSVVRVSSEKVVPRNDHAAEDLEHWMIMEPPQAGYEERCYYHSCPNEGRASVFQPKLGQGLAICFDPRELDCFTQWKMMGVREYVLGLEPGNCLPDGRAAMREKGILKTLAPGETVTYHLRVELLTVPEG